jgi:hypothetical protein
MYNYKYLKYKAKYLQTQTPSQTPFKVRATKSLNLLWADIFDSKSTNIIYRFDEPDTELDFNTLVPYGTTLLDFNKLYKIRLSGVIYYVIIESFTAIDIPEYGLIYKIHIYDIAKNKLLETNPKHSSNHKGEPYYYYSSGIYTYSYSFRSKSCTYEDYTIVEYSTSQTTVKDLLNILCYGLCRINATDNILWDMANLHFFLLNQQFVSIGIPSRIYPSFNKRY